MMSAFWLALVVVAAPPYVGPAVPAGVRSRPAQPALLAAENQARSGIELRDAVRAALRHWACPSDAEADRAAQVFLGLFRELGQDTRMARSRREYYATKVRGRLLQLSNQISKRIARERRLAKADRPGAAKPAPEHLQKGPGNAADHLGQRLGAPMPAGGLVGGGPVAGGRFNDDHGQQLVNLIQRTVAPTTWDVNGGPGTIHYWRPGRALVVRQTDAVHDELGGVLRQLDRAGR